MPERRLTDADVEAIASALTEKFQDQLYKNLGKGLWGLFTKGFVLLVAAIAAYGYFGGRFPK